MYLHKNNTIYYIYDEAESLIGLVYNNTQYYYKKNLQGDIIGILDENLNEVVKYQYDSWGTIIKITDQNGNTITDANHIANINPYRYRSYRYDTETGLYYLQSRYYNPEWGRFLNADGLLKTPTDTLLSHNMYAYCENNYINMIDESGSWAFAITAIGGLLGKALAATIATVASFLTLVAGEMVTDYITTNTKTQTQTQTKSKADPITKTPKSKNHSVYTLRESTGVVKYVGRTSRPLYIRETEHKLNPFRNHLNLKKEATNLDAITARGLEQTLIEKYQTLNKRHPMYNQRNEIAWDNPKRNMYMNAARMYLDENETYVGP